LALVDLAIEQSYTFIYFCLVVLGMEPRALHMLDRHSATEVHPSPDC
jgi:hypothetical protein